MSGWMYVLLSVLGVWAASVVLGRVTVVVAAKKLRKIQLHYDSELVPTDPRAYPDANLVFYDTAQRALEAQGFQFLGDIADASHNRRVPDMRTFVRVLCDPSGATSAGIYHVPPGERVGPEGVRVIEFETEVSNGCFLTTSNAAGVAAIELPPRIMAEWMAPGSTPVAIWNHHQLRLADALRTTGATPVRRVDTLQGAIDAAYKIERLKREFRSGIGTGLTRQEVRGAAGMVDADTKSVLREFEKLDSVPPSSI